MEAKLNLDTSKIKCNEKDIETEIVHQSTQFNKRMLRKLNELALDRAFQLDRASA